LHVRIGELKAQHAAEAKELRGQIQSLEAKLAATEVRSPHRRHGFGRRPCSR